MKLREEFAGSLADFNLLFINKVRARPLINPNILKRTEKCTIHACQKGPSTHYDIIAIEFHAWPRLAVITPDVPCPSPTESEHGW